MTYALLLWPHNNQRYEEAAIEPAQAEMEILLNAAGIHTGVEYRCLSGAGALIFEAQEITSRQMALLSRHSLFFWFGKWEDNKAFLPIEAPRGAYLGSELAAIQKYKGKTNERFTQQLINLAFYSSRFEEGAETIHLLDPMCGRGTTLFQAVNREWNATGIDADKKDVLEGVQFFEKYLKFNKMKHKRTQSSRTVPGKSPVNIHSVRFGGEKGDKYSLNAGAGDAMNVHKIFGKEAFHILACDLPYGVQHGPEGEKGFKSFDKMLRDCLPAWREVLKKGGAISLSYNTHTLKTETVRKIMEECGFEVMRGGAYDRLGHWVEQAVNRDIAVCVKK